MKLSQKQGIFAVNFAKLILFIESKGWYCTVSWVYRPDDIQDEMFRNGLSKTRESQHELKLAGDLNLFVDGVYRTDKEAYKPLADYWKSLHPDNVAGYDWGWDGNHFEMK